MRAQKRLDKFSTQVQTLKRQHRWRQIIGFINLIISLMERFWAPTDVRILFLVIRRTRVALDR